MLGQNMVDLTEIARDFPRLPEDHIQRENILETIERTFESGVDLISVEGQDGIGKTTLLAEFAARNADRTLSLFIRPISPLAYDPDHMLLDLCNQLHWLLYKKDIDDLTTVTQSLVGKYILELEKLARVSRHLYYLVIDGLDDIPDKNPALYERVMGIVPPSSHLRFLLAIDPANLPLGKWKSIKHKSYPASGFAPDDTRKYLSGIIGNDDSILELHYVCKGIPGHLASAKRSLLNGVSLDALLKTMPDKQPDLFAIEWEQVDTTLKEHALAIIAFGHRRYTPDNIAALLKCDSKALVTELQGLSFLRVDPGTGEIAFLSETFRSFAETCLYKLKDVVAELIIERLSEDPESEEALVSLPDFLQDTGKLDRLLEYLSPDIFVRMLERTHSLAMIQRKAEQGIVAADKLNRPGHLVRFCTQRSMLLELDESETWSSEIDARMALRDYDSALALAQSSIDLTHRLKLLALIAREEVRQGLNVAPELVDQIRLMCKTVDAADIGDDAVDIACDLLYISPELAIGLVEESAGSNAPAGKLDWAFARLSLVASDAIEGQPAFVDVGETIRSRIKDPAAQRFASAAGLLFGNYSAKTIIEEAAKKVEGEEGLFILRQWAKENATDEYAADVVEYALDLAIETTAYTPKARDFREIATPLPHIRDRIRLKRIIGQFDSLGNSLKRNGPIQEYVRLQLLVATAENSYDRDAAVYRILDLYCDAAQCTDVSIKCECLTWLRLSLTELDPNKELEASLGIHASTENDFAECFDSLLSWSADHFRTTRNIIRAIAKKDIDLAIRLSLCLNTEARRDHAILESISSALRVGSSELNLYALDNAVAQIVDVEMRDEAVLRVIERCASEKKSLDPLFPNCLHLLERSTELSDPSQRCIACSNAYALAQRKGKVDPSLVEKLENALREAWQSIDVGWHRIYIGFHIVRLLADQTKDLAESYMHDIEALREQLPVDSEPMAQAYIYCCRLAIRAYPGLFKRNLDTDEDLTALERLIDSIPSSGERSVLWAELAIRCYFNGRIERSQHIVSRHVVRSYANINDKDEAYKEDVLVRIAPALYCFNVETAFERVFALPDRKRDEALSSIARFLLCKQPSTDPYDVPPKKGYRISYDDAANLCTLIDHMSYDAMILSIIEAIASSIAHNSDRTAFSREQIDRLAARIEALISSKLPDPKNIQHQGYVILAQAQMARLRKDKRTPTWSAIIEQAGNIPNTADRAFVLSSISEIVPATTGLHEQVLSEAKELTDQMPDILDRLERYESLAAHSMSLNKSLARECIKQAMGSAAQKDDQDVFSIQRRLIDLAYKIDADFASTVADIADTDTARISVRQNVADRLRANQLREQIKSQELETTEDISADEANYPQAAWMLLGELNSRPHLHKDFGYTRRLVRVASRLPISQSYPILAWVVQNALVRHHDTDQAATYLRPMFDAMVMGAALTGALASRSMKLQKRLHEYTTQASKADDLLMVHEGEREKALTFLVSWYQSDVSEYLVICDPYFGPQDLEALQLLWSVKPQCKVSILTSTEGLKDVQKPYDESFRDYWRMQLAGSRTPKTTIVIAGIEPHGKAVIHDRWWLSKGSGLDSGTSFNAWGGSKTSAIKQLTPIDAATKEREVELYLSADKPEKDGSVIRYSMFVL